MRQRATEALAALYKDMNNAEMFSSWLEERLAEKRDRRKEAGLKSLLDKPLPKLALRTLDGKPFDTSSLRGKVLLLNFFASW